MRRVLTLVLKRMFPRLMTFTATGRSTAHTKCRNEVEDLERSGKLCGRAVADNVKEAGKHFADKDDLGAFAYCSREVLCRALELEFRLHP